MGGMVGLSRVEAYRRRVWRLAYLLVGDEAAAGELFNRVMRDRKVIESVEPERLDRLILMRVREQNGSLKTRFELDPHVAVLYGLPSGSREAWLLTHVEDMDELSAAKAMDCSKKALAQHLTRAEEELRRELGENVADLAALIRQRGEAIDPVPVIRAWAQKRRRVRLRWMFVVGVVLGMLAMGAWSVWHDLNRADEAGGGGEPINEQVEP